VEVFIISYLIQIPLAIYAAFFIPMRGELSTYMENGRKGAIAFGIVPCPFFSVVLQLGWIGVYMLNVKRIEAQDQSARARLGGGSLGGGGNPFGGSGSVGQPSLNEGGNPFSSGQQPRPSGEKNPFGEESGTSKPPETNPFA
jgi:hypothetical protein